MKDETNLWKKAGATFLHYLPKKAYLVSLDDDFRIPQSLKNKVRTVIRMSPEMKYHQQVYDRSIPEYAAVGNKYKMHVRYFEDLDPSWVAASMVNVAEKIDLDEVFVHEDGMVELNIHPRDIRKLALVPFLYYIQPMEHPGEPDNYKARTSHRVNAVSSNIPGGYNLDGSGVVVSHGDDGIIGEHIDFTGRLEQRTSGNIGDHGDHVAGTIFGAGNLEPEGRGMAPDAEIIYYSYPNNLNNIAADYANDAARITASSYSSGCNSYTNDTRQKDQDMRLMPHLVHVFSAGNNNGNNCGYGAGSQWGNITGGHKQGKNVIAVANLNSSDLVNRFIQSRDRHLTEGSNRMSQDLERVFIPQVKTIRITPKPELPCPARELPVRWHCSMSITGTRTPAVILTGG